MTRQMITRDGEVHPELSACERIGCQPVNPNEISLVPDSLPLPQYDAPPTHYAGKDGMDPWAVWDAFDLDRYTANAVKYLLRAGKKDIAPRLDDLKKARNYINKLIELEEQRGG